MLSTVLNSALTYAPPLYTSGLMAREMESQPQSIGSSSRLQSFGDQSPLLNPTSTHLYSSQTPAYQHRHRSQLSNQHPQQFSRSLQLQPLAELESQSRSRSQSTQSLSHYQSLTPASSVWLESQLSNQFERDPREQQDGGGGSGTGKTKPARSTSSSQFSQLRGNDARESNEGTYEAWNC